MSRALVQNLSLLAGSAALTLLVVEAGARMLEHGRGGKEQRETTRYMVHDEVLGWRKAPNREVTFTRRDYVTTLRTNSQGLRDRERPVAKPPGEFRVVALGDSFIEAFMMKADETPTEKLRGYLSAPGCDVDVINGGTSGYSTDQEYLAYDLDLHRYQPDVVALFVYHNDIPPLPWGKDKPVLDLSVDPPVVRNLPVPPRLVPRPPGEALPFAAPPVPSSRPFLRSAAIAALRVRLEASPPGIRARLEALGVVPPLRRLDLNDELLLYAKDLPEHLEGALVRFQGILAALKRRTARDGARLLVVYIPSRLEVNREDWEITKARYGIGPKRFDPRSLVYRLMTAASREDVPFLDLTDALVGARGAFARPYFATDSHWNARGADAGAREVARTIRHLRWAPACAA